MATFYLLLQIQCECVDYFRDPGFEYPPDPEICFSNGKRDDDNNDEEDDDDFDEIKSDNKKSSKID